MRDKYYYVSNKNQSFGESYFLVYNKNYKNQNDRKMKNEVNKI
jgi:hypothetical protein